MFAGHIKVSDLDVIFVTYVKLFFITLFRLKSVKFSFSQKYTNENSKQMLKMINTTFTAIYLKSNAF